MKKVLSVLLAAAMVMGMSVSAFAANFGDAAPERAAEYFETKNDISYSRVLILRDGAIVEEEVKDTYNENHDIEAGDVLLFSFKWNNEIVTKAAPKNWKIKVSNDEFVVDEPYFYVCKADDAICKYNGNNENVGRVFVAVEIDDSINHFEEDEVNFFFYITDGKIKTETVTLSYDFRDYYKKTVEIEEVTEIIPAQANTYYKLASTIKTSKMVVFEFDEGVYVTAKMWPGESYLIKGDIEKMFVETEWSKALSKEYDTDITVLTLDTELDIREILFESAKENKQIVEVVDGALVAVDSEWVTRYEVIDGIKLAKGYISAAEENGSYALISADIELIEVEKEATKEETKENPSTGANDFVGAAVALAVVSVAAAGALALKK